jgi:outer membrane protein TolC
LAILTVVAGCGGRLVPALEPLPDVPARGASLAESARAARIDLSQPLSGDSLAAVAVVTNPDLIALRTQESVAQAQVFAAGLLPDPTFTVGFDRPRNGTGLVTAVASSLGVDVGSFARREIDLRVSRMELDRIRFDVAWAEWLTGQQARLLALRVGYLERAEGQTDELRRLAEAELERVLAAVSRGALPATELETRRLAATDAADRDRSAELELAAARLDLNRVLGLDPSEMINVAEPNVELEARPGIDELFADAVSGRADLAALRVAYDSSAALIDTALLGRFPRPSITLNDARDTGAIRTLGPSISLTLPVWNRGRGDIRVAQATRDQLRAEYLARLESVRADIAAANSALTIARLQLTDVDQSIEPLIPQAEAAERAAAGGDLSVSAATAYRLALLDKQIVQTGLSRAVAEYGVALELAVGRILE